MRFKTLTFNILGGFFSQWQTEQADLMRLERDFPHLVTSFSPPPPPSHATIMTDFPFSLKVYKDRKF